MHDAYILNLFFSYFLTKTYVMGTQRIIDGLGLIRLFSDSQNAASELLV